MHDKLIPLQVQSDEHFATSPTAPNKIRISLFFSVLGYIG